MLLYANVETERASKGQGGNKHLKIVLTAGKDRQDVGTVELKYTELNGSMNEYDEASILYYRANETGYRVVETIQIPKQKGKKKKDEAYCANCSSLQKTKDIEYLGDQEYRCPNCR